jgi:dihydroorotate dehydrogenase
MPRPPSCAAASASTAMPPAFGSERSSALNATARESASASSDRRDRPIVIVASGGIGSGADAAAALAAGADLVQLWTGMIYAGPGLIGDAVRSC